MDKFLGLFSAKPKGKDEIEAVQRNDVLRERSARIEKLNADIARDWKVYAKAAAEFAAASQRIAAATKKYAHDRGDGLLCGEEMDAFHTVWGARLRAQTAFNELAVNRVCAAFESTAREAENFVRHHKTATKDALTRQIELAAKLSELNQNAGADIEKLNATTKAWHVASAAARTAEAEFECFLNDYQVEEAHRLVGACVQLCRVSATETATLHAVGETHEQALQQFAENVVDKQARYSAHKNARDAELLRLRKLNDQSENEGLMQRDKFESAFKQWSAPADPARIQGEVVGMRLERVLSFLPERLVGGVLMISTYRLMFVPYNQRHRSVVADGREGGDAKYWQDETAATVIPLSGIARIQHLPGGPGGGSSGGAFSSSAAASGGGGDAHGLLAGWAKDGRTFVFSLRHSPTPVAHVIQFVTSLVFHEQLFALTYKPPASKLLPPSEAWNVYNAAAEYKRMGLPNAQWRLSDALNARYQACASYPNVLCVPATIPDTDVATAAAFRFSNRLPVLVWKSPHSPAAIFRCSQPHFGVQRKRSELDERLLRYFHTATRPANDTRPNPLPLLIADCRPAVNAVGNVAKGGGWEVSDHYPFAKVQFLDIENIHAVRDSLSELRGFFLTLRGAAVTGAAVASSIHSFPPLPAAYTATAMRAHAQVTLHTLNALQSTEPRYRKLLEQLRGMGAPAVNPGGVAGLTMSTTTTGGTGASGGGNGQACAWFRHVSSILAGAVWAAESMFRQQQSVVVHCSDGWDRTPQLTSLTALLLDPYYRTLRGFAVLVEREWVSFGHKFAQRCGHNMASTPNQGGAQLGAPHVPPPDAPKAAGGSHDGPGGEKTHASSASPRAQYADEQRSPVWVQFLDCVAQVVAQFPHAFEFNELLLAELVDAAYGSRFGTFLCNTDSERETASVRTRTSAVWSFLYHPALRPYFVNPQYRAPAAPTAAGNGFAPLLPVTDAKHLRLFLAYFVRWDQTLVRSALCVTSTVPAPSDADADATASSAGADASPTAVAAAAAAAMLAPARSAALPPSVDTGAGDDAPPPLPVRLHSSSSSTPSTPVGAAAVAAGAGASRSGQYPSASTAASAASAAAGGAAALGASRSRSAAAAASFAPDGPPPVPPRSTPPPKPPPPSTPPPGAGDRVAATAAAATAAASTPSPRAVTGSGAGAKPPPPPRAQTMFSAGSSASASATAASASASGSTVAPPPPRLVHPPPPPIPASGPPPIPGRVGAAKRPPPVPQRVQS